MTDLCWVCQQNSTALLTPLRRKSLRYSFHQTAILIHVPFYNKIVKRAEAHLMLATKARSYLKAQVKATKDTIKSHYTDKGLPVPSVRACLSPASNEITVHFSFDMAQQV